MDNAFIKRHLYSEIDDKGGKIVAVERELQALETRAEPVLDKLISAGRAGRLPLLTETERSIWDEFFVVQWRRVPDLSLEVATDAEVAAELARIRQRMKIAHPDLADQIDALGEPDEERVVINNARVKTVCGVSDRVRSVQRNHGIALAYISTARKSFIIGSRPVVQLMENRLRIVGHPVEMWLPIAPDIAVGVGQYLLDPNFHAPEMIIELTDHSLIRRFNIAVAVQSTAFASHSKSLTASIAEAR